MSLDGAQRNGGISTTTVNGRKLMLNQWIHCMIGDGPENYESY